MPSLTRSCTKCSRPIPDDSIFCPLCGADLPTSLVDPMHKADPEPASKPGNDPVRDRLQAALGAGFEMGPKLGEGAFGVVYRATDVRLRREVAVKLLRRELVMSEGFVERFEREAQALAALRHPGIVPVYSIGEQGELIYLVMPFIEGVTLTSYLREHRPLPLAEAERILSALGSALSAAHAVGLVHRDIKPDNIMLEGPNHQPLLMDFGIAKVGQSGGVGLTSTGMVLGTPLYMSPEQATADPNVDPRADIYSLGVLAYEMFTGALPYTGDSVQAVLGQHLMTPVPESRSLRPEIPSRISLALRRAMAKKPGDRYQRVEEFTEALGGRGKPGPRRLSLPGQRGVVTAVLGTILLALAAVVLLKGSKRVERTPVHAELRAEGVRFRLAAASAPWDRALVLSSLGIAGLDEVTLPSRDNIPARKVATPTLFLKAVRDSSGISIDPIRLPAGSVIGVKPTGVGGTVQLSMGDSLPSIPVSVSGRIAVSIPEHPPDTIPFRIDQIQLAAPRGALDLELGFDGTGAARPLASLEVIGVSFEEVSRFRDEEQVADERTSMITSGSFGLAIGNRPSHTMQQGEELPLHGFKGTIRDLAVDSLAVGLTLEGTIDSLPPALGSMPSKMEVFWSEHRLASVGGGLLYMGLLALVALYWKRGTR
jgi:serine/threonine protein kinase